ncbi:MAG TPA: ABC transporter permease [Bacteroidia bacterium]|nr:ABC transporter permease [Bacteroidota bacterium]MBP9922234.1 ABC transporter permease [Bacteroidia bacterium]HQV99270.1 ABC transporter permease [Bacteroidia bacterium]HQW22108.1 ABC transporter permease [Bacteroidia bacterium]
MSFYLSAVILGLGFASLAMGIFISMRIFNIPDITTDGSFTLGGVVAAVLISGGHSPLVALPIAFLAGAIAGALTGIIHTRLKVNALLAGILVMTALYSINLALMGRSNLPLINSPSIFNSLFIPGTEVQQQFIVLIIIISIILVTLVWLMKTDFGLAMRATGNNEKMIRALGVNTDVMKIFGLALANGLTAVSGYLITQVQGFADINMGIGIVIIGLGSVMIGQILFSFKRKETIMIQLLGVIVGSILFRMILAFALSIGIDAIYLKLVVAVFVLAVVSIPNIKSKA